MNILGIEKMSLVDYDGKVAATVFTGGCNFKCPFCHNSPLVLDFNNLPTLTEDDIFSYLKKRQGILDGVCVSGGEPTLQKDLPEFIEKIKALGYSVKLDTNGTNPELIKTLNENKLVDYFAMDIKNDRNHYAEICGFDKFNTERVEKSVEYFLSGKADYEFRTTLIAEYHKPDNILSIGQWIKGANKYFLQKFKDTGSCIKDGLSAVSDATVLKYIDTLKNYVSTVKTRGYDL
ncbi:MAG: anaerobic ribonucleoside-triphosphate reductase activating protein [Clostridia bacterium]|nr:anaerobic ribonucleoside-triphosphate reductase activating protein [Clostridia bacterium]